MNNFAFNCLGSPTATETETETVTVGDRQRERNRHKICIGIWLKLSMWLLWLLGLDFGLVQFGFVDNLTLQVGWSTGVC